MNVPWGQAKIARRFNGGCAATKPASPGGTAEYSGKYPDCLSPLRDWQKIIFTLDSFCPAGRATLGSIMGYLIEIDPLHSHIKWPQPESEKETEDQVEAQILPQEPPVASQSELDLNLKSNSITGIKIVDRAI